jgi:hypothetical protein
VQEHIICFHWHEISRRRKSKKQLGARWLLGAGAGSRDGLVTREWEHSGLLTVVMDVRPEQNETTKLHTWKKQTLGIWMTSQ